jgi:hypothetical protein
MDLNIPNTHTHTHVVNPLTSLKIHIDCFLYNGRTSGSFPQVWESQQLKLLHDTNT